MSTGTRITAFGLALAVVAGVGAAAGGALDPLREPDAPMGHGAGHGAEPGHAGETVAAHGPGGLAVAEGGLTLAPETTTLERDAPQRLAFRVIDAEGATVTNFDRAHERDMHLIVVRRDLTGYQHLHPRRDADGRWTVRLRLPAAGVYRAYADFRTGGHAVTLATDLHVGGTYAPADLPGPRISDTIAGYRVDIDARHPSARGSAAIAYRVSRAGEPVADLQPYLGADGHLVALREGDLALLHVHPEESSGRPGEIRFAATFPSAGRYRLFLQFRHDGHVRTVAHTVVVGR